MRRLEKHINIEGKTRSEVMKELKEEFPTVLLHLIQKRIRHL